MAVVSEHHHRLKLDVETPENALLVVSDTFFPGWKVLVDGKAERVLRANYQFRAVAVPPGAHRVEFVYDPLSFKLGVLGTLIGVIGCMILLKVRTRPTSFAFRNGCKPPRMSWQSVKEPANRSTS